MTNNEAAKWIQIFIDEVNRDLIEELGLCLSEKTQKMMEAIEMGRDALKRMEERTETHACDLISRQVAIDAVKKNTFRLTFAEEQNCEGHVAWSAEAVYSDVMEGALLELPSAQPETHEERTETHACDLISRQVAIEADGLDEEIRCEMCKNPMHTDRGCDGNCKYDEILYEKIIQILNKRITPLPSAQPEQRWIPCSERLPEERDWYLGIFKESDTGWINPIPFICDYLLGTKTKATTKEGWILKEHTDREEYIDYYFNLECVAWMPLPEPYKGGEKDG